MLFRSFDIEVTVEKETDKARFFRYNNTYFWAPKSIITDVVYHPLSKSTTVTHTAWMPDNLLDRIQDLRDASNPLKAMKRGYTRLSRQDKGLFSDWLSKRVSGLNKIGGL